MNDKVLIRMCVCCRKQDLKQNLIRVFNNSGNADYDSTGKSGGRGAYICSPECLKKAYKTGRLAKALKCGVSEKTLTVLERIFESGN